MLRELELPLFAAPSELAANPANFLDEVRAFAEFGSATHQTVTRYIAPDGSSAEAPTFINEFWTSGQRQADNLHEVSYRACFKPQLPRFFINRLTASGELVYDPFMGRGTTLLEAAFLNRNPAGNDINPLSRMLIRPRLNPPSVAEVQARLKEIPFTAPTETRDDLLVFYHPETLAEICALRAYLLERDAAGLLDSVDDWIRMTAINRLSGHSAGFFSVYSLPPNQAVSIKSQQKINERRNQVPPRRSVPHLILKKTKSLLKEFTPALKRRFAELTPLLSCAPAAQTRDIPSGSVSLVVTSPPFLDIVQYATDNWLRCWFAGIDPKQVSLTVPGNLKHWQREMTLVFHELHRVLKAGGHVAFEVGEVRGGSVKLEETVLACGVEAGLQPVLVLINAQEFTKTANCWGVSNNAKGTNSNRIVLFRK